MVEDACKNTLLSLNYTPPFVRDITDGDSNIVLNLGNKYLYKKFVQKDHMRREIGGLFLYQMLTGNDIPLLVTQGPDYYISEYVKNAHPAFMSLLNGSCCSNQVSSVVSASIAKMYWAYQAMDKSKLAYFPDLRWETRLRGIRKLVAKNQPVLRTLLPTKDIKNLLANLASIARKDRYPSTCFSLVHGDIHLDNLLIPRKVPHHYYLIDFEHCMEAPIELELCNSIFWHDEKSLAVPEITKLLKDIYNISYSLERETDMLYVYFIDQLNQAIYRSDRKKCVVLVNRFRELRKVAAVRFLCTS
jgi:hypothetical protein